MKIFNRHFLTAIFLTAGLSQLHAETITFSADSMSGTAGSKNDSTTLTGSAFVKTSSMEIKADSIILSGDNFRYISAEGNVSGVNSESQLDFTCGRMKYDRETKIAQLEDSVHLIDKANDVTADAQLIEYNQNTETAIMQIGITLKQKDNTCTSAFAIYKKEQQMLEMSGNPKIIQGDDSFRAQEIILNLDSQEITLDGRVRGTVSDSKKETAPKPAPEETQPPKDAMPEPATMDQKEPEPQTKESEQQLPEKDLKDSGENNE